MKYDVKTERFVGISEHAAADGQQILIMTRGFFTPEDGNKFYKMLDSFESLFLGPFTKAGGTVAGIEYFLVLISGDVATVYINDDRALVSGPAKRNLKAGENVSAADFAGISEMKFENTIIPPDVGIAFYFSVRWRRGLFFDFTPLHGGRLTDINRLLGGLYDRLTYSELYSIPDPLWPQFFEAGWFPFIALIGGLFEELPAFFERNILYAWEQKVLSHFDESKLKLRFESWQKVDQLKEHLPFLERGLERYIAGDYLSAISNVWPRVEGILRFLYAGPADKPGQRQLLEDMKKVLENKTVTPPTYFPALFENYLLTFYYQDFKLTQATVDLSRHSHAHGVSSAIDYDRKKALIGLLMVDQLFYYIKIG